MIQSCTYNFVSYYKSIYFLSFLFLIKSCKYKKKKNNIHTYRRLFSEYFVLVSKNISTSESNFC